MNIAVFRKDEKNVGDWWSVPSSFFPISVQGTYDLAKPDTIPNNPGVVILGGGGLGRQAFEPYMKALLRSDRKYQVIGWGIGADSLTLKGQIMPGPTDMHKLLTYFDGLDEIGTRIHPEGGKYPDDRYRWVPCASCMSDYFDELRSAPIRYRTCVYEHLREPLAHHIGEPGKLLRPFFGKHKRLSNRGTNLSAKLAFLAQSEFIITNSYHGVYWGTLLARKVICVPFKNGLFSFKHAPAFLNEDGLESAMDRAVIYRDSLEECRRANIAFYQEMKVKYDTL